MRRLEHVAFLKMGYKGGNPQENWSKIGGGTGHPVDPDLRQFVLRNALQKRLAGASGQLRQSRSRSSPMDGERCSQRTKSRSALRVQQFARHDIALVQFSRPIDDAENVKQAELPLNGRHANTTEIATRAVGE